MSQDKIDILKRTLEREKRSRKAAEKILEAKSAELFQITRELQESNSKLESLLKEKTTELKGVFENIVDAYAVIDLSGNVLKMNEAAVQLLGFKTIHDEVNLMNLVHPMEIERAHSGMEQLVLNGSISNYELKIITAEENLKLVSINASLIYTDSGQPIAAQGIVRDITDERTQKEIIEEQKSQLDIIVENSPIGIVLTHDTDIIKINSGAQNLFGYSKEELELMTVKDLTHPDDRNISRENVHKMDSGLLDHFALNKRYIRKDGSVLWAKTTVSAVRDSVGGVKYQVAIIEDISKERERQLMVDVINNVAKAILGKVNYYEIAWEIVHEIADYLGSDDCVIYILDPESNNLEQVAAFGQKVEDQDILNKISIPLGQGIVGRVAQTGIAEIVHDTTNDPRYILDDDQRLSEITVPIISKDKVIGVIDSEHKDIGYYSQDHLDTLTNIARIVSIQLDKAISLSQKEKAEEKNKQLLKALERSNNELQEYAHVVSHDLKSPLRSLYALVHWLKEDNASQLDENSLKNISMIESTLENMEQLISDVLDYSSVTSGNLEDVSIDLNVVVSDVKTNLHIPDHIELKIKRELPVLHGDRTRFTQLFQNLISNAVKYNDKEKGLITIDVEDKKTHYLFSVEDNGIGIDKKYYEKIFEVFQALGVFKQSTGVGLSIVKKIVDLYHGD
ncbi:MAG: PAS domain S-box protein, partial [Flavobacteriaceae bacterium]|nr:PAS domain S-box protein [Flavobacteriaceae bacterium]